MEYHWLAPFNNISCLCVTEELINSFTLLKLIKSHSKNIRQLVFVFSCYNRKQDPKDGVVCLSVRGTVQTQASCLSDWHQCWQTPALLCGANSDACQRLMTCSISAGASCNQMGPIEANPQHWRRYPDEHRTTMICSTAFQARLTTCKWHSLH